MAEAPPAIVVSGRGLCLESLMAYRLKSDGRRRPSCRASFAAMPERAADERDAREASSEAA